MPKFSEGQLEVLTYGARGHFYHYDAKWALPTNGRPVGREVAALVRKGLIDITYYHSGPGMSWTAEGRRIRAELNLS